MLITDTVDRLLILFTEFVNICFSLKLFTDIVYCWICFWRFLLILLTHTLCYLWMYISLKVLLTCHALVSSFRCHFDLLKKSDKVLRELKNLDAQKWWANSVVWHSQLFYCNRNKSFCYFMLNVNKWNHSLLKLPLEVTFSMFRGFWK